ncbi:hypothetical protein EDC01DRAFT_758959 [Geopyxis carbonaria]|nr:hypothetical protein EDC01DRAFT_758959 [Geopyxis carbonaria]
MAAPPPTITTTPPPPPCPYPSPPHILIAGASLTGLVLSHLLHRLSIPFTLLESHTTIAPQLGASIGLHPHTLALLDQLDLWAPLSNIAVPLHTGHHYTADGKLFGSSRVHRDVEERYGYPIVFMERRVVLEVLWRELRARLGSEEEVQKVVKTGERVVDVVEHEKGVTVTTAAGAIYTGDLLFGADGIHSAVRASLSANLPTPLDANLKTTYTCVFGISARSPSVPLPPGVVINSYATGASGVAAAGTLTQVYWFLFVKLPLPAGVTTAAALVDQYADMSFGGFTLRELWDAQESAVLSELAEGLATAFHSPGGRTLLLGDAAHKVTINAGLGGNCAVEGAAVLANLLAAGYPLEELGRRYEAAHRPRAEMVCEVSAALTRMEAYDTRKDWVMARCVVPRVPDALKAKVYDYLALEAPVLEQSWAGEVRGEVMREARRKWEAGKRKGGRGKLVLGAVVVGVAAGVWWSGGLRGLREVRWEDAVKVGVEAVREVGDMVKAKLG